MGAPNKVGDDPVMLAPLRVSTRLKETLDTKAEEEGIKVSDARRKALELYICGVNAAIDDDLSRTTGRIVE